MDPWFDFYSNGREENDTPSTSSTGSRTTMSFTHNSVEERLLELTNTSEYSIVQRNGQRIYGGPPPGWEGPPPERGCEVFVGKVPRDCFEDELVPVFTRAGPIYELRMMMDFSGSNRGYFFVKYTERDHAKLAVKMLNNYEIRPGKKLGVIQSVDNRKLWISGIPKNRTAEEIKAEMGRLTDGVRDVILYPSQMDKSKTRGYAFIEYETHRAAALARRKLVPGKIVLLGHEIEKVDWAEPEVEVDEEVMKTVRVLHIRNLLPTTTESTIKDKFVELSNGGVVEHVKKTKDFAFVHFVEREAAEVALAQSSGLCIEGSPIVVQWSKPVDKHNYNARKQLTRLLSQNGNTMFEHAPLLEMPDGIRPNAFFVGSRGAAAAGGAPGTAPPRRLVKIGLSGSSAFSCGNSLQFHNGLGSGSLGPMSSPPPANGMPVTSLPPPSQAASFGPNLSLAQVQMAAYYGFAYGGLEPGFGSGASAPSFLPGHVPTLEQAMINLNLGGIQQQH